MHILTKTITTLVIALSIFSLLTAQHHDNLANEYLQKIDELFKKVATAELLELMIAQEKRKFLETVFADLRHIDNDLTPRTFLQACTFQEREDMPHFCISQPSPCQIADPLKTIQDYYQHQELPPSFLAALKYLQNPQKFQNNNKTICNTFLFAGPPGCGKTYLAELIQKAYQLPMVAVSAAQLHNKYVGAGAERIAELFSLRDPQGRILIIFIDEIDGMINRFNDDGNSEQRNTLNELLVHMQKNANNPHIFIIAATNHKEALDPALLSRFEGRLIEFAAMTQKDREKFIYQELPDNCANKELLAQKLARATHGFSRRVIARLIKDVDMYSFAQTDDEQHYILTFEDFAEQIYRIKKEQKLPWGRTIKIFIHNNITYINLSLSALTFVGLDYVLRYKLAATYYLLHAWYSQEAKAHQ